MEIEIKKLVSLQQAGVWQEAFTARNYKRPDSYYSNAWEENGTGTRVTLLAYADGVFAGCGHLLYESDYFFFKNNDIPEINDLNVFPEYRGHGIANHLMDQFEFIVSEHRSRIGIGVGLFRSYGAAQRIYCRRGYIPDGNGIVYGNEEVLPGTMVYVDHDLALYFVKEL